MSRVKPIYLYITCDSVDGKRTGKQHIYQGYRQRYQYTDVIYTGNKSLCGKYSVYDEDEINMEFEKAKEYNESKSPNLCKNCLRARLTR